MRYLVSLIRQLATLATALSLAAHIGSMALGSGPQPMAGNFAGPNHPHYFDVSAAHPDESGNVAGHPQPCCILSFLDGLTPSPDSVRIPPRFVSAILNLGKGTGSTGVRPAPPYPVGARAPPLSA